MGGLVEGGRLGLQFPVPLLLGVSRPHIGTLAGQSSHFPFLLFLLVSNHPALFLEVLPDSAVVRFAALNSLVEGVAGGFVVVACEGDVDAFASEGLECVLVVAAIVGLVEDDPVLGLGGVLWVA